MLFKDNIRKKLLDLSFYVLGEVASHPKHVIIL